MAAFKTRTIEEVTETLIDYRGKTPPKAESGVRLVTAKVIKDGFIREERAEYISEKTYASWMRRGYPQQHDIVLTVEAPLGEVAQLRTTERIALAQRVILLRGDPNIIDQQFFFQAVKSPFVQAGLQQRATGTTVLGIKQSELRQVNIPFPSLPTQRKIAAILSAYDDLIENNLRRIKILEEMAQNLYREWFVKFGFPGHRHTRFTDSFLGRIPEGWRWAKLKDVCDAINYGFTASANKEVVGPKFLRITDIVPSTIEWERVPYCKVEPDEAEKYALSEGDIVIARTGATTGYAKRLNKYHPKSVFASYLVRIRPNAVLGKHYVGIIVESDKYKEFIKRNIGGAAQPQANAQVLTSIDILIPATDVIQAFDEFVQPLADKKELTQIKNQNLRRTRDLLLPRLISGEVDVSELDIAVPEEA